MEYMAFKDAVELIKKFTAKDKFKPTAVQAVKAAVDPQPRAMAEDILIPSEGERVHFLNAGRSDCILIQSGDKFALVDCGSAGCAEHTAQYIKAASGGAAKLEFIAVTHLHEGHIGALESLLDDADISIGKLYMKKFIGENLADWDKSVNSGGGLYERLAKKAESLNIPVIDCLPEEPFMLGNWRITLLNTETDSYHKNIGENDNSLALLLEQDGKRLLLAGDMVNDTGDLARMANRVGRVDVFKVPCHGERAIPDSVMDRLKPNIIIVTNRLADIADETLVSIMSAFGRMGYSTVDCDGVAITLSHDGLEVSREIHSR